jgi:hypothetical protein
LCGLIPTQSKSSIATVKHESLVRKANSPKSCQKPENQLKFWPNIAEKRLDRLRAVMVWAKLVQIAPYHWFCQGMAEVGMGTLRSRPFPCLFVSMSSALRLQ